MNSATLGERKNMNLPGVIVDLPTVTDKDEDDIINFGLKKGIFKNIRIKIINYFHF